MAKLRTLSGKQVCSILARHGFDEVRRRASHIVMQRKLPMTTITVPVPNHDAIRIGTLQSIIRQSGHTNPETAVYGGHYGVYGEEVKEGWCPYEHLAPSDWKSTLGESYRRCCTSVSWVGEALAARLIPGMEDPQRRRLQGTSSNLCR